MSFFFFFFFSSRRRHTRFDCDWSSDVCSSDLNGRMADRVGRADHNLADNLHREAAGGKYRYFWFEYTPSAAEGFGLECTWYHRYHPTDNPEHPNAPLGAEGACPVKGCQVGTMVQTRG